MGSDFGTSGVRPEEQNGGAKPMRWGTQGIALQIAFGPHQLTFANCRQLDKLAKTRKDSHLYSDSKHISDKLYLQSRHLIF